MSGAEPRPAQTALTNVTMRGHAFLADMWQDPYFPNNLVTRGQDILVTLCQRMETEAPADAAEVYALTHVATEAFNTLAEAFEEAESEIETAARDNIAVDVEAILTAYGHALDLEEALAPRDW